LEWAFSEMPPIRRGNNGTLEINSSYPLFNSLRYGEVFKKTLILAFLISEDTSDGYEFYYKLSLELLKEFKDLAS